MHEILHLSSRVLPPPRPIPGHGVVDLKPPTSRERGGAYAVATDSEGNGTTSRATLDVRLRTGTLVPCTTAAGAIKSAAELTQRLIKCFGQTNLLAFLF